MHTKVYIAFGCNIYISHDWVEKNVVDLHVLFGGEKMIERDEISKAFCKLLAEIADQEKKKAIQRDDYGSAFIATIFEGLFKEAENSFN